jgi:sulfite exporter TauE/SafE
MFEFSALAIGFLGSFHCVAMCGPIALSLSGGNESTFKYLAGRSIYNSGRIITYSILGFLAGLAGHTLMMAGFQKSVSVVIGIFMILSVVLLYYLPGKRGTNSFALKINSLIKKIFSTVIRKRNKFSLFIAGLANWILPCGFVYLAMAGAAATQTPMNGALYMILFGLGTFPAMMAVAAFGKIAGLKARGFLVRAAPIMMIMLGIYFIYRGCNMKENNCCEQEKITVLNSSF